MHLPYPPVATLRIAALSYLGCVACCAIFQRRMIYHPSRVAPGDLLAQAQQAGLQPWRNAGSELLIGWRMPADAPGAQALVLHGNADTPWTGSISPKASAPWTRPGKPCCWNTRATARAGGGLPNGP